MRLNRTPVVGRRKNRRFWIVSILLIVTFFIFLGSRNLIFFGTREKPKERKTQTWKSINKYYERKKTGQLSNKWIIMTSISPPTLKAVEKLVSLTDWNFICIGDTKTPNWNEEYNLPSHVHFLGVKDQLKLNYRILKFLPLRHYGRKNIGYLYAIERGAEVIYETDDDTILTTETIPYFEEHDVKLKKVWSSVGAVNVYSFFQEKEDPYIWPRGLPLQYLSKLKKPNSVKECKQPEFMFTPVQQYLQDIDPDVDAIFRLTHSGVIDPKSKFRFSSTKKKSIGLPPGIFSPYNTQNTVTLYSAFWGLLLPVTVPFRVCDIWRGYWVQRMIWEIGGVISFIGPSTTDHIRNPHDYFKDFLDEEKLYVDSERFINFLRNFKINDLEIHFFDIILKLSKEMVHQGFWEFNDHLLMEAWLNDLIEIGYLPPSRINRNINLKYDDGSCGEKN